MGRSLVKLIASMALIMPKPARRGATLPRSMWRWIAMPRPSRFVGVAAREKELCPERRRMEGYRESSRPPEGEADPVHPMPE